MLTREDLKQAVKVVNELDNLLDLRNRLTKDGAAIASARVAIRVEHTDGDAQTEELAMTPEDVLGTIEENIATCRRLLKAWNIDPK